MARLKFLKVVPNPWTHIDTDGDSYADPAGHILHDPEVIPPVQRQLVGCEIGPVDVLVPASAGNGVLGRPQIQRTRIRYYSEPTSVMNRPYYRKEIALGHLFAADAESARECGIKDFVEPRVLLEQARAVATAEMLASNPYAPDPSDPLTNAPATVKAIDAAEGGAQSPAEPIELSGSAEPLL